MGVKGLWRLLMPIGRRISIETLEGKILAVDASIWLTQFLKAMRDPDTGKVQPAAHLIGFIRRLCKLRYQGIRPVFVFDGATPEIKQREVRERRRRREQFRNEGDSVQRMAKRLLMHQLKKQGTQGAALKKKNKKETNTAETPRKESRDTTTAAGAYAPDFYDPEMDNEESTSTSPKKGEEENTSSKDPVDPEVADLLEDEHVDYLDKATSRVSDQSDWDITVIDGDQEQDEEARQKEGQTSSETTDIRAYVSINPNDFDVEYVASLPSTKRKDVVEDVQRKRRLESRREFMKVAYDPEGLSKCQLRNFLKSTKLNQNIQKMAQQASKVDAVGDPLAADGRKRIIFENDGNDDAKKKENKEQTLKKLREVRKLSVMSSSDDESSDDVEWLDENDAVGVFGVATRPKAILDSDDCDSDEDTTRKGNGFRACEGVARMPSQQLTEPDEDSVESEPGGFIKTGGSNNKEFPNNSKATQSIIAHSSTERTSGTSSVRGVKNTVLVTDIASLDEERKQPARTSSKRDNVAELEVNDEAIARALQESEYSSDGEGGGGFLSNNMRSAEEGTNISAPLEPMSENSGDYGDANCEEGEGNLRVSTANNDQDRTGSDFLGSERAAKEPSRMSAQLSEDSEDEDIDWEDGEGEGDAMVSTSSNPITELPRALSPSPYDPGLKPSEQRDEYSDGENIEDEDGNNDEESSSEKNRGQKQLGDDVDDDIMAVNSEEKDDTMATRSEDSWADNFRIDDGKKSKEMSAALEHAQATAANLTNWAGRAFRRAVAQHAAENGLSVPESAQPKSTQNRSSDQIGPSPIKQKGKEQDSEQTDATNQELKARKKSELNGIRERKHSSMAWPEALGDETVLETLEAFQDRWTEERNQEDRDMDTVTDEMRTEAMTLLQLFGVPFVEAPAEAEAQCVMLEKLGLVDGTVTEDSDAFVFGGQRVYKNIFDDQKYVEAYDSRDAEKEMNLTRDGLVALAMLLGGDYTEGVKGVGIVNGMEIVHAFDVSVDVKAGLSKFREWLDGFDPFDSLQGLKGKEEMTKERLFHRKHHSARTRWNAPVSFPNPQVMTAYLNPVVDVSAEKFTWAVPDMDRLVLFLNKHVGWSSDESRKLIQPVVDKISSGRAMHQTRIDSFMRYEDSIRFADIRSKRLREVLSNAKKSESEGQEAAQNTKKSKNTPSTADDGEPAEESKYFR